MTNESVAQDEVETSRSLAAVERQSVVSLEQATKILAQVKGVGDIPVAVELANQAEAVRLYSRKAKLGLDAQNDAAEIKLHAERAAGKVLAAMDKAKGARGNIQAHLAGGPIGGPPDDAPTLTDLGLNKNQSSRWQTAAAVSDEETAEYCAEQRASGQEISSADFVAKAKRHQKREVAQQKAEAGALEGLFRVVYADPPWQYGSSGLPEYGHAEMHYPTMSVSELCSLPVQNHILDDAVLFLWVTSPILEDAFKVIAAWGFQYKNCFVWDKIKHNYGNYNSVRHEFLLICTRGSCVPDQPKLFDSVVSVERTKKHSEKPQVFRDMIETLYTSGAKLELFARSSHEGWSAWGNEVD